MANYSTSFQKFLIFSYSLDSTDASSQGYFVDMNVVSNGSGVCGGAGAGDFSGADGASTKVWRGVHGGDPRGVVVMDICDNYEFGENRTKVVNLEIRLWKTFLNAWFGTKY